MASSGYKPGKDNLHTAPCSHQPDVLRIAIISLIQIQPAYPTLVCGDHNPREETCFIKWSMKVCNETSSVKIVWAVWFTPP